MKVNIVNIGCFKNLVDCELLMWQLRSSGVVVEFGNTEVNADIVVHYCPRDSFNISKSNNLIVTHQN